MNRREFFRSSLAAAVAAALPYERLIAADQPVLTGIEAVTGTGGKVALDRTAVQELKDSLRGALLLPGEPGYDTARRVLNQSIDKHPALVVQPTGVADIRNAVSFARDHQLLLAVKCGGHSYSGKSTCDGGMQIDLSRFRAVRVDPLARVAYVAGGSLLGELDHETMALGLVTTAGTVSHTGVGGLTLGAGFGRLARRFGLALDNVRGVDIVTADGRLLHASAEENPDLFWGVRGGGGNFGVVTSFEFNLHPMQRQVVGGNIVFPIARARELLAVYSEYSLGAPDELYADAAMIAPLSGKDGMFMFHVCWSGDAGDAEKVLAPLRKLGTPLADTVKAVDYVALQRSWDDTDPRNEGEYLKSGFINGFPPALVETIASGFEADAGRGTTIFFQHSGGAIGRVSTDATAFPHRRSRLNMLASVNWPVTTEAAPHVRYIKDYWSKLERFTDGYYTNEVADEGQRVVDENYQGNLPRLRQIKAKYDPANLFRLNANVKPA
ncbi:MAG: FAD-binding oxidoreductase [Steroidobacteraceae bacterium]|nr:FAD-binding oxidoreductase [Steroidobacteraceae bacterium]